MYGMGKLKVKSIGCFLSIFSLSKVVAKELLGNVYFWDKEKILELIEKNWIK